MAYGFSDFIPSGSCLRIGPEGKKILQVYNTNLPQKAINLMRERAISTLYG